MGFLKLWTKTGSLEQVNIQINCQINSIGISLADCLLCGGSWLSAQCVKALWWIQRWMGCRQGVCPSMVRSAPILLHFTENTKKKKKRVPAPCLPKQQTISTVTCLYFVAEVWPVPVSSANNGRNLEDNVLLNHALMTFNPTPLLNVTGP